ncbi:hypothetical protein QOT17_014187 [Balamuthia mandrillaris]
MQSLATKAPRWERYGLTVAQAARPIFVNGKWRKPMISGRHLAELRKCYLAQGLEWEEPEKNYKATWRMHRPNKPNKLHKRQRPENIEKRQKMIQSKLKEIPKIAEQQKKARKEAKERPLRGIEILMPHGLRPKTMANFRKRLNYITGGDIKL